MMLRRASQEIGLLAGCAPLLVFGCGDAVGDPIDRIQTTSDVVEVPPSTEAVLGLCEACGPMTECGDANDLCLSNSRMESFCGRDCLEGGGCPAGYECSGVRGTMLEQCVPIRATCAHRSTLPAPPAITELRAVALRDINRRRIAQSLPAFVEDSCLDELAQSSASEASIAGVLFGKYRRECLPIHPECACSWASEQASVLSAYGLTSDAAILGDGTFVGAIERSFYQPGLGTTPEMASEQFKRIGVGIVLSGDEGTFSFAFGP